MVKPRKIPLRKCTGCHEMRNKKELIRVIRGEDGGFSIDFTGKKNGRGAYVCNNEQCLEKAHKQKGLERSFKAPVPVEIYEQLKKEMMKSEQ